MKVLIISSNIAGSPYPVYPLGAGMIAQALISSGHEVEVFDFLVREKSMASLIEIVDKFKPQVVGISIRNIDNVNLMNEQKYTDIVKDIIDDVRIHSQAKVLLGGAGFSIMPQEILDKVGADYGIVGEGEELVVEFMEKASKGQWPDQQLMKAELRLSGPQIPSAYYDPLLMSFYLKSGNMAGVQTKRGCLHACVYCTYPFLEGARLRCREPKAVVDDIEYLVKKHKAEFIFFTDSVFNDDEGHYLDVCRQMKSRKLNVSWTAFFKPDGLDEFSVSLMKETGLKAAEMGADAASDIALKGLGKTFCFDDVRKTNNLLADHGIATAHYFMFGAPGETKESVLEGIENIKKMERTVSFIFMGIRILPGTKLYNLALKEKVIKPEDNLIEPVYYISSAVDKEWLQQVLTESFKGIRHCVFPPDALESSLQFMHKLGYSGLLWEMLIPGNARRNRKKKNVPEPDQAT